MIKYSSSSEAKKTLKLAGPIIFGEIAQMALHLVDSAMIGAVGYKELAAVSLVFSVINIPFVFGIGLSIAVSQLVSLASGKSDKQLASHYFFNAFCVCAAAAVLISLGLELGKDILFHLDQDPEVARLAVPFLQIMGISVIPMLLFMALKHFTDGLQYTKTAMVLSVMALPLNILLNWLLIFGNFGFPALGLVGAGYATLITRITIFVVLAIVILYHPLYRKYMAVRKHQWYISSRALRQVLFIGVPSGVQICLEMGAFTISAIIIGTLGAVPQAAHQIAIGLASLTFIVSMGLSQAGSIRVSNAYGSGNWPKIHAIGKGTLIIAMSYGAFCALFFTLLRNRLPYFFNDEARVVEVASTLLLAAAVFQVADSIQVISAGLLRGIRDVKIPTILIGVAYWALGIPIGWLLVWRFNMGATGIWLGFIAGLAFAAIFLTLRFYRMVNNKLEKYYRRPDRVEETFIGKI